MTCIEEVQRKRKNYKNMHKKKALKREPMRLNVLREHGYSMPGLERTLTNMVKKLWEEDLQIVESKS